MRLLITTPTSVPVDVDGVRHVRAEDETGAFGIRPRHADFLTVLALSVLSWTGGDGHENHVALRGGVLSVIGGRLVQVATREAVPGDDLDTLEHEVVRRFREDRDAEREARTSAERLQLAAIREIHRYLYPDEPTGRRREGPQ